MNIGQNGLELIASAEGFRGVAYYDANGKKWTIGYGHTATAKEGMKITKEEGLELLRRDIAAKEDCIERNFLKKNVILTQNQFDALVSMAYNLGCGGFLKTDVAKYLQKSPPDYKAAADSIVKYNKSGGKVLAGLTKRRTAEQELFLGSPVTIPDATKVAIVQKTGVPETAAKADAGIPSWVWWAAGGVAIVTGGGIFAWKKL